MHPSLKRKHSETTVSDTSLSKKTNLTGPEVHAPTPTSENPVHSLSLAHFNPKMPINTLSVSANSAFSRYGCAHAPQQIRRNPDSYASLTSGIVSPKL